MKMRIGPILMVAIAGLSLLALACGSANVTAHNSYVAANTVEELVSNSSVIVIGEVLSAQPSRLEIPGKLPSNPSQSDPNYTGVARVYQLEVERYLKGDEGTSIQVVQFEGSIVSIGGQATEVQWETADYPLTAGTRYLLFLTPQGQVSNLWLGTAQPFRFAISDGLAKAEGPSDHIKDQFPDATESSLVNKVETLVSDQGGT